jgi:hypothetical protein
LHFVTFAAPFLQLLNYPPVLLSEALKREMARAFLLSRWFFFGKFAGAAKIQTVVQAKIIVNPQTLITTHHALLLVLCSRFYRVSSRPSRPDSRFFGKFRETGVELTR